MLILSYLIIALKRLRSRLGLTLLLLLSSTLTIGLIACIPIFAGAVSRRIMEQELATRAAGRSQPSLSVRVYAMGSASRPVTLAAADQYGAWLQDLLERVGIFGLLSVCFAAGALLAALGLLMHSAAAMKGRSLRFAVLQALGLARHTLLSTLLIEYLVVVGYGIAAGLGLGLLTSRLYGPFFQLTDLRTVPIPPARLHLVLVHSRHCS